ncbi:mannitol dehydrogenase family protein [Arenicella xantha]|uniref:Fructuronate reductase n=1 Tax=Arenicella xantha TaxID=644221 RepID=A0A395JTU6_9GAMM|nr:mannitol dehydrogenase family protein [Arenicella xantha]RBP53018.1 fructuronate reductase [Arenicella xantha]
MRLSKTTLACLPLGIDTPAYAPEEIGVGIVHLGIGAFHRCHMAVYTDDAIAANRGNWKIIGVSLRSTTIRDQLNPQDGLYTIEVRDNSKTQRRVIGSIDHVLFAPEQAVDVIAAMSNTETKIISLTVTEKGYCHDPATGELNQNHPDIKHDIANPSTPKSAIGFLVAALQQRCNTNAGPVTLLSCDNLPSNGQTLRRIVTRFAALTCPNIVAWIDANVTFPSSMVDRIVPAMEPSAVAEFTEATGVVDQAILQTEPFTQWVIEDSFAASRPAWEQVGATLVGNVEPYEETKLRMLNGSHSALAYLGYLAGFDFVHQAMAQADLRRYVNIFMRDEAATSLTIPSGLDIDEYRHNLQQRYDNSALQHRTYQIAMDGSQKIPQRLLSTLRFHLAHNGPIEASSLAIAAWMRYVMAHRENGEPFEVQDPLAARFKAVVNDAEKDPVKLVTGLLGIREIFADDLIQNQRLCDELTKSLRSLLAVGALKTLAKF